MLGTLRRNFKEMDVDSFISLYRIFVSSHLECAESVWNPLYIYLIDDLDKVQKRAPKNLRLCRHLNYRQCLEFLPARWYASMVFATAQCVCLSVCLSAGA